MTNTEWTEISREFDETLGYLRQDIRAIRKAHLGLNYTVAFLICCACEALSKCQGRHDHEVFTSLLPQSGPYRLLGKYLFDALRHGLAHRFRPKTIKLGKTTIRLSLSWEEAPHLSVFKAGHAWLCLNMLDLERALLKQIDEYEAELQTDAASRTRFSIASSKEVTLEIPRSTAPHIEAAWLEALRLGVAQDDSSTAI